MFQGSTSGEFSGKSVIGVFLVLNSFTLEIMWNSAQSMKVLSIIFTVLNVLSYANVPIQSRSTPCGPSGPPGRLYAELNHGHRNKQPVFRWFFCGFEVSRF